MRAWVAVLSVIMLVASPTSVFGEEVYDWNFKPMPDNEPSDTEKTYKVLLDKYGGLFIGNSKKKTLYLTFDNGYENGYTEKILDVLKEKDVPATFFVTGHYLNSAPDLVKRMATEGHIVGNHSWHHPSLPEKSKETIKKELDAVKNKYKELTGKEDMYYLRPPQGKFNERSLAVTQDLGYINVFWSFAYMDWDTSNQLGEKAAFHSIMKRIHPGAIMLLHSVSKDNANVLGKVIDECRKQGYTFKSLDELIYEDWMEAEDAI
ncbi:delta-lactam-biosynthetic de-N-acetylase [Alteribacillus iranensis]|uniref:Peptidoglycan-N-acetylmuramic acid deacetylase n=1 Tax=Alteribacillus iranensis TaxID=930128 RepID=A0A1I2F9F4_9BACI|nr:delta-lactam-biosynthetic de-N-acetylase [Alteribacillus iranensis]SFF02074.1 peptidoglycan-N-acetylmuramic acid deacetylase [Alteribacillus iranensis]